MLSAILNEGMTRYKRIKMIYFILAAMGMLLLISMLPLPLPQTVQAGILQKLKGPFFETCSMGKVCFRFWKGVDIHAFKATYQAAEGYRICIEAPDLFCRVSLVGLCFRRFHVSSFVCKDANVTVTLTPVTGRPVLEKRLECFQRTGLLAGFPFSVGSVELSDIHLTGKNEKGMVLLETSDLCVSASLISLLGTRGTLSADTILLLNKWPLTHTRASLTWDGRAVGISQICARFLNGKVSGSAEFAPKQPHPLSGKIELRNLFLDAFYKTAGTFPGELKGRVSAFLALDKQSNQKERILARFEFQVTDFQAHETILQQDFAVSLFIPELSKLRLESLSGKGDFSGSLIRFVEIKGVGNPFGFLAHGNADLNGHLAMSLTLNIHGDYVKRMPKLLGYTLERDESGNGHLTLDVAGMLNKPKIKLERRIVNKTINRIFDDIRGLFRK